MAWTLSPSSWYIRDCPGTAFVGTIDGISHSSRVRVRPAIALTLLCVCSSFASEAGAQGNSALYAYPTTFTALDQYNSGAFDRQLTFLRLPGLSPDYRLGPGDEIEVTIVGISSGPAKYAIDRSGEIVVPLLGPVKIAELTAEEAEKAIAEHLARAGLVKTPQVLVYISAYEAKPIYVVGELDRQGQYFMSQQLTLMDLIFLAGGLDFTAARYAYLHRKVSPDGPEVPPQTALENPEVALPGTTVIKVDLKPMTEGGVLSPNIALQAGDVLAVPRAERETYYVFGAVQKAGMFEVPAGSTVRVSQAVAWAGGPEKTARTSKGVLVRHEKDGSTKEIPVDFSAILEGKKPDVVVEPDDIIFIPDSAVKSVASGALNQITRILSAAILFR